MDMKQFLTEAHQLDCGVEFNTYKQGNLNYCYIKMSQRGKVGIFFKEECLMYELNDILDKIINDYKVMMKLQLS